MAGSPNEGTALAPATAFQDPDFEPAATERGSLGACGLAITIYADLVPAGMLPCAYMCARTGELPGSMLMVCFAVAHVSFSHIMIRAMEVSNQNTLGNLLIYVLGVEFAWLPLTVVVVAASGCCIGYLSFILEMMPDIFPFEANTMPLDPRIMYLLPPLLLICPSCLCRNFTGLLTTSVLATVSVLCTVLIAVIRAVGETHDDIDGSPPSWGNATIQQQMQPIVILTASFFCHYNTCRYYREMTNREPLSFALINATAVVAALMTFGVFAWSLCRSFGMSVGYSGLGGYAMHDSFGTAARVLSCISILGSFPLAFGGARAAGIDLCRLSRHPRCVAPCFLPQVCLDKLYQIEATMSITPRDLLAPVLMMFIIVSSLAVADIHNLADILTAASCSVVFFGFPPLLFLAATPKRPAFLKGAYESLLSWVGLFCGSFVVAACNYVMLVPRELAM